ncbi:uncharacterized protein LOC109848413 isoform X1 [Asparagus officinalis]|nr:uncharacterized protein LOC109848413 isoform X1 [Asparagus officinalis]XP_020273475.1 uncharacterized protein LOC109848413 isoform X1 [Asparagus officinalis]
MDDPPEVAHNQGGKGIQEVTGGKVSPVAWAQPMSPSDVAGQSSRSLKYQPVFFQPVFLQQAIPGAALPPMLAQTSQAIPGATIPPILAQTSQSSGTQLPSHGDGNGSSQKYIRGREVEEISSSSKRTKKEGSNKSKRSGESRNAPNKMWQDKHDDVLIPFLADLAKKGYKCDKSFKKEAFSQATDALNSHFGENFTTENVYNHMKSLKRRYVYMCECLKISGASWDEESKMIKLDQFPCENWDKVNPNLKDYVNKPLKHFDDLSVIIGDAFATGEFRKGVYNKFGGIPAQTINIDSDEHKEDAPNNQETSPSEPIRETPKFKKSQMTHGTSLDTSHARPRVRRTERAHMDSNMKIMEKMVEKVGEMAFAIQNAHLKHWSERLSDKVYALTQFPQHVLDHAFETLYEDERQARLFIARPIPSQVAWMNAHVSKFGLHTSDEIVTDEDGMGAEQREGT